MFASRRRFPHRFYSSRLPLQRLTKPYTLFSTISPDSSAHHLLTHPRPSAPVCGIPSSPRQNPLKISDFNRKSFAGAPPSSAFPERPLPPHSRTPLRGPTVVILSVHFVSNKNSSSWPCVAKRCVHLPNRRSASRAPLVQARPLALRCGARTARGPRPGRAGGPATERLASQTRTRQHAEAAAPTQHMFCNDLTPRDTAHHRRRAQGRTGGAHYADLDSVSGALRTRTGCRQNTTAVCKRTRKTPSK